MKTTIPTKTILLLTMIVSGFFLKAQNNVISFQISRDISGSGLGGNVCPNIAFTYNRNTFSIGPNIQRRQMNFSGAQMNYRFSAGISQNKKKELFFSGNLIVHNAAYMSQGNIEIEKNSDSEEGKTCEHTLLRVIECYAGIGLKINMTKCLNVALSSGIGGYDTFNKKYDKEMYRQKSAFVMQMNFVLIYNLNMKETPNKKINRGHSLRTKI